MYRRTFLTRASLLGFGSVFGCLLQQAIGQQLRQSERPRILLRSSWQTVNIGDIAHTPGVLAILETYLPDAEVTLWPSNVNNGVEEMLQNRFPKLKILKSKAERDAALKSCDFLLHGSGPSLVAEKDVLHWKRETGKPFGVYGITLAPKESSSTNDISDDTMQQTVDLLSEAEFVYFRDSKSLAFAKSKGCQSPLMEFGPDGAFGCDLRNDAAANQFLQRNALQPGKFLCCIPRLRYTPYWTIPEKKRPLDQVKHARNEQMKEHDHSQLRQAIIEVTRNSDYKILICPEDQTQMQVGKELLYDRLPNDVRNRVVWREQYWLTDEALSTYACSSGLFGNEMHSPIMCIGNAIPAIVCRFAEQTWKGLMWEDIGLGEWLFDLDDESDFKKIVPAVVQLVMEPHQAKKTAKAAQQRVQQYQSQTMKTLEACLT